MTRQLVKPRLRDQLVRRLSYDLRGSSFTKHVMFYSLSPFNVDLNIDFNVDFCSYVEAGAST